MLVSKLIAPLALASGIALVSAAPSTGPSPKLPAQRLEITARDFAFEIPDSVPAGLTTVHLVNKGPDIHHAIIVRLEGGHTASELADAMKGPPPMWAVPIGGPNAPAPGGEATVVVDLKPGSYALMCLVPGTDSIPHLMKGMSHAFTVVPAAGAKAAVSSRPDATLSLVDYAFTSAKPLTAGSHLIRVRNDGKQMHEVELVKLEPNHTAQEVITWIDSRQGPPPGMPMGGVAPMVPGMHNDLSVDLAPGKYAFICFLPDMKDGKPHFVHGMVKEFTVR